MTDFCDLGGIQFRTGRTTDRPTVPPDKQAFFWDRDLSQLWGVNDSMEWVLLNAAPVNGVFSNIVSFSYLDSPIVNLMTVGAGVRMLRTRMYVDTLFNGSSTLRLGDVGDRSRLMSTLSNIPSVASIYQATSEYTYTADTVITLQMAGAFTQGAGRVSFMYEVP